MRNLRDDLAAEPDLRAVVDALRGSTHSRNGRLLNILKDREVSSAREASARPSPPPKPAASEGPKDDYANRLVYVHMKEDIPTQHFQASKEGVGIPLSVKEGLLTLSLIPPSRRALAYDLDGSVSAHAFHEGA